MSFDLVSDLAKIADGSSGMAFIEAVVKSSEKNARDDRR